MAQTYCGKDCSSCSCLEDHSCPGCYLGPGRQIHGDCEIAKCCRSRGHTTCSTCTQVSYCGQRNSCHRMPELRRKKQEAADRQRQTLLHRAPFFAKWLAILFWLFLPAELVSLVNNDMVLQYFPALQTPAVAAELLCALARGVVLLILAKQLHLYRIAGICGIFTAVLQGVSAYISSDVAQILLGIATIVLSIVALYYEYQGHIQALYGVNDILSQKWADLWRWEAIFLALAVGGTLMITLLTLIAALAAAAGAIGGLVVGIIRLVYLYQSAAAFREYIRMETDPYALP